MYPINTEAILGVQEAQHLHGFDHGQGQSEGQIDNWGFDTCFAKTNQNMPTL